MGSESVSYTHLFFLILACQRPDAKYLGDGIRDQFNFRVALGRMSEMEMCIRDRYEKGARSPKENYLNALADIFDVSPHALAVPDIDKIGRAHV